MRVFMLNPPYFERYSRQSRSPCVTKGGTFYYPYFLAYATGALEKAGFKVRLLDAVARKLSREEVVKEAEKFNPGLVVLDTSTPSIYNDVEVASLIKEALPGAHVTLVGTHPTAMPEETLGLSDKIDSLCLGEYDYTLVDLAEAVEEDANLAKVKGLCYRSNGGIRKNEPRELIKNLDALPFVSRVYKKHLNIKDYFYASLLYPQVTILTARGCPYNCSFCNAPFKNSYRARSVENVLDEFEYIQGELPEVKEVMIEDETFPVRKKRTLEFCEGLKERGIKLRWSCNARVNTDYETLRTMKLAGCRLLCVGFETPTQLALDSVRKGTTKELQLRFMEHARKLGLLVNGCFMLGLPGDSEESIRATIEFAKKLNPDTAQFYPLMVYPGTEAYRWAKEKGYLVTEDYSKWVDSQGRHATTISYPDLSKERLVELCDLARKEFYLRREYILYKAKQSLRSPSEALRTLKSAKTFFRHLAKSIFS
jgi:radical SAM superfamily enzyme YgiQ (UPF0313 family)